MNTDCCKMFDVQTPDIPAGFDYRTVQPLALEKPWHVMMVEEETVNVLIELEGNRQKRDEETEAKGYPVLIDFEKICLWDHDGGLKVGIRMEDPDYMKKRLLEWIHSVAAYVRFLHVSAYIT